MIGLGSGRSSAVLPVETGGNERLMSQQTLRVDFGVLGWASGHGFEPLDYGAALQLEQLILFFPRLWMAVPVLMRFCGSEVWTWGLNSG